MKTIRNSFIAAILSVFVLITSIGLGMIKDTCLPCGSEDVSMVWMLDSEDNDVAENSDYHTDDCCCGDHPESDQVANHTCCDQPENDGENHQHKKEYISFKLDFETLIFND
ncbi:hypothetical protein ACFLSY_11825, partial [Bacteroidota bacterium]